jgi:general stress protein 26
MKKKQISRNELKHRILEVLQGPRLASLATLTSDGNPWVRFVVCYNEGLNIYVCTYGNSRKARQIRDNPNVHIAMSMDCTDLNASYIQIAGRAAIRSDSGIKKRYWKDFMKKYYTGIEDPNYVVLEVKPRVIEYKSRETEDTLVYTIGKT